MQYRPVSINEKFKKFSETFKPKVIAQMNDYLACGAGSSLSI